MGLIVNTIRLSDVFVGLADRWGDSTAVGSPQLTLSYSELIIRAARSARELRSGGIGPGARVGIAIRDGAETVVLMIALWMLGATVVPIDFRTNSGERARLANEFDLLAVLEDREIRGVSYASMIIDPSWTDLIARHDSSPLFQSGEESGAAFISLTSGTTSRPIGFILDHERALLRFLTAPSQHGAALLNPLSLSFSGSRTHTFSALFHGAAVRFHPVLFSPEQLAEAILAWNVTSVCVVPTIIRSLLELGRGRSSPMFYELDAFYSIGAPILAAEKLQSKTILCTNFIEDYGSTVSGPISSLYGSDVEARPESLGRVRPHTVLQIVDENDRILPFGETGVIRVRCPGMARSTYGSGEQRSSGDMLKAGWAYPGDIGTIDEKHFLRLVGRSSDVIIRGGANVHPAEVEAAIGEHEGVQDVAVVGFTKFPEGQEIAAFVVGSNNVTEAALVAHCRARLSSDKRPRKFLFVKELPRNANGKISRAELRKQLEGPVSAD